jgi:fluoroquinolone resistance protein
MKETIEEKGTFREIDYSDKILSNREFDACEFVNCNFTKCDLSNTDFVDCKFESCNFSMAKFNNTGLKEVSFKECKLLGIDFSRCNDFLLSFKFDKCYLDYSSFHGKRIRKIIFKDCIIKEADFSDADLTASGFINCDLARTVFQHTVLEKVDFRTSFNYSIDLEMNRMKGAKFSSTGIIGLLDKYQILVD